MAGETAREQTAREEAAGEKVQLVIHKGEEDALELGGLRFVACRREIEGIDGGVTLNVCAAPEGEERDLLRFDFFRKRPHYHVPAENQAERTISAESFEAGLDWGLGQIATRIRELLREAGYAGIAAELDSASLAHAAPGLRALIEGLAEPSETSFFEVDAEMVAGLAQD